LRETNGRERRTYPLELTVQRDADGKVKIVGYAARFNVLSEDLGGWKERISAGAFSDVLKDDCRGLFNHNPDIVLGRTTAGTARMKQDDKGLYIEIDPPDTEQARGVITAIERGDVTGQSFTFQLPPMPEGRVWEEDGTGLLVRTITRVARIWDFGPVTFPAYPDTDVSVRSKEEALAEAQELLAREQPAPDFSMLRRRLELQALI
jgi:HK97 family phage prohead protease